MSEIIDGKKYLCAREASEVFGYTPEYLSKLARENKIEARRLGKAWYLSEDSIRSFVSGVVSQEQFRREELSTQRANEYRSAIATVADTVKTSTRTPYAITLARIVGGAMGVATLALSFGAGWGVASGQIARELAEVPQELPVFYDQLTTTLGGIISDRALIAEVFIARAEYPGRVVITTWRASGPQLIASSDILLAGYAHAIDILAGVAAPALQNDSRTLLASVSSQQSLSIGSIGARIWSWFSLPEFAYTPPAILIPLRGTGGPAFNTPSAPQPSAPTIRNVTTAITYTGVSPQEFAAAYAKLEQEIASVATSHALQYEGLWSSIRGLSRGQGSGGGGSSVTNITNTTVGADELSDLSDILFATPTYGDVLLFDGAKWVNAATSTLGLTGVTSLTAGSGIFLSGSTGDITISAGGGSGGGSWSTTTSQVSGVLVNYPNNASDAVAIGSNATTSAEYWFDPNTLQAVLSGLTTLTNASTTNLSASYASSTRAVFGSLTVGSLSGILKATAGVVTAAALDLAADVGSSILAIANGGTGWANIQANSLLLGNGTNRLATTSAGTNGQVLALVSGVPSWVATSTLSEITGTLTVAKGGTGTTTAPLSQLLYGGGTGVYQSVATTSFGIGSEFSYSGTLGALVGGANGSLTLATNGTVLSKLAQIAAGTILGNPTGATGNVQAVATSTLYTGTAGQILSFLNGAWTGVATTTFSTGLTYSAGNVTNTGLLSLQHTYGSAQTGALTFATSTATTFSGLTIANAITNSSGTFTFAPPTITGTLTVAGGGTGLSSIASSSLLIGGPANTFVGYATSSLGIALSDTTGTLAATRGGTGQSSYTTGDILYASDSTTLTKLGIGGDGTVLKVAGGVPTWGTDLSGSGGSGSSSWATTTSQVAGQLVNYSLNATDIVAIGATATTSAEFWFDPNTRRSIIPFASSTALTAENLASTSNLVASNSFTFGAVSGFLKATVGVVATSLIDLAADVGTSILAIANGGTGWANIQANSLLLGNGTGRLATTSAGTNGQVLALVSGVPSWVATSTLATISGTLAVNQGGTGTTTAPLSQLLYGGGTGVYQSVATTTFGIGSEFSYSGTLGALVGGANGSLTLATNGTILSKLAQIAAGTILGNPTGATGNVQAVATSTLYSGTAGQVLAFLNGAWSGVATTTFSSGLVYSAGNVTLDGSGVSGNCVQWGSSNSLTDAGAACGSGSGGANSKWATSTVDSLAISLNSALRVGIGTTTPKWALTIASSTGPQLALTDESLTNSPWTFRSINGSLYIATSSPTTFATSTIPALSILANGNFGIGTSTPGNPFSVQSSIANQFVLGYDATRSASFNVTSGGALTVTANGTSLGLGNGSGQIVLNAVSGQHLVLQGGGNTMWYVDGGSGDFTSGTANAGRILRTTGSATAPVFMPNQSALTTGYGSGVAGELSLTTGGVEAIRIDALQRVGIGTTTPRFALTIASSTGPQLALTDTSATQNPWTLRSLSGNLYISTSSPTTFATSSVNGIAIDNNNNVTVQKLTVGGLSGFLKATAGVIATATIDLAADVGSSILAIANGGTGWANIQANSLLLGNGTGRLATTSAGTNGQILSLVSGVPSWVATTTFSTGLTYAAGNVTVNTSQNIATLSNLTTNGILYTSGGAGTLNVDSGALDIANGGTATTTFYNGGVVFYNSTLGTLSQAQEQSGFFFDNVTSRLGVGTTSPFSALSISTTTQSALTTKLLTVASTTGAELLSVLGGGGVGISSSSPWGLLSVHAPGGIPSFVVGSSTATQFVIDQFGNVGIGTTTPSKRLSVTNTASAAQLSLAYDATRWANFQVDSAGDLFVDAQGADIRMNEDNLWVCAGASCPSGSPSGNGNLIVESKVGIGTSTPNWPLQVSGTRPSIALSDDNAAANLKHWLFSSMGGNLYIGTSTDAYATTTPAITVIGGTGSNSNFVGIGTSSPTKQLSISNLLYVGANGATGLGTATSTFQGDIKILGKLDVSTIDPVYTIGGHKYATYGASTIGIKEEQVQTMTVSVPAADGGYEYVVDFNNLTRGSDLWLFYQVTDWGSGWKDLVVTLTPGFEGRVSYEKDTAGKRLVVKTDQPGEISMRLIANRHDSGRWPNSRPDQDDPFTHFTLPEKP